MAFPEGKVESFEVFSFHLFLLFHFESSFTSHFSFRSTNFKSLMIQNYFLCLKEIWEEQLTHEEINQLRMDQTVLLIWNKRIFKFSLLLVFVVAWITHFFFFCCEVFLSSPLVSFCCLGSFSFFIFFSCDSFLFYIFCSICEITEDLLSSNICNSFFSNFLQIDLKVRREKYQLKRRMSWVKWNIEEKNNEKKRRWSKNRFARKNRFTKE
jgi:hypothetical protein